MHFLGGGVVIVLHYMSALSISGAIAYFLLSHLKKNTLTTIIMYLLPNRN